MYPLSAPGVVEYIIIVHYLYYYYSMCFALVPFFTH